MELSGRQDNGRFRHHQWASDLFPNKKLAGASLNFLKMTGVKEAFPLPVEKVIFELKKKNDIEYEESFLSVTVW